VVGMLVRRRRRLRRCAVLRMCGVVRMRRVLWMCGVGRMHRAVRMCGVLRLFGMPRGLAGLRRLGLLRELRCSRGLGRFAGIRSLLRQTRREMAVMTDREGGLRLLVSCRRRGWRRGRRGERDGAACLWRSRGPARRAARRRLGNRLRMSHRCLATRGRRGAGRGYWRDRRGRSRRRSDRGARCVSPWMAGRRRHHDALGRRRARDSSGRGELQGAGVEEQGHRPRSEEQRDRHQCRATSNASEQSHSHFSGSRSAGMSNPPSDFTFLGLSERYKKALCSTTPLQDRVPEFPWNCERPAAALLT
jgi:hypothetical protein